MRLPAGKLAVTLLTALALTCALAAASAAEIVYTPCRDSNDFACGHLTVPLDRSGATPGTLTLALRRHRAPVGSASTAVVALAGGPGQAAIPFSEGFSELLGPALGTRDLIVFDQRGTGLSHPLSCHAFEGFNRARSPGVLVARCAAQIGPTRADFTTADSVADIEALRAAGGYEKLVLYGTSYGTKVAEEYAQEHPNRVEALVLDSVVPPNGPDPLSLATFAAIPHVLRALCADDACAHITPDPVADLARLVRRLDRKPLSGRLIDGHGHATTIPIVGRYLLGILLQGDFSPLLRAEFIPAVRAAADGDPAALTRLLARAYGGEEAEGEGFDNPLYFATSCEEQQFPFGRSASPHQRIAQAQAAIAALPASTFAPFTAGGAFAFSDIPDCAFWPFPASIATAPREQAPLPNVPALILSGDGDLRTPTANARSLAAQIPDAHLLVVPYAGHSVLTDEPTSCAVDALRAMFAAHPIAACRAIATPTILRPPPLPPARLSAVAPAKGLGGKPGRTLAAVQLTFADFSRQLSLEIFESLGSGRLTAGRSLDSGGLRAGWAGLEAGTLTFHGYSYVPGVTVSGSLKSERVELRIGGAAAAHGTLHLAAHHEIVGTLGGRRVHLRTLTAKPAADAQGAGTPRASRLARTSRLIAPACRVLAAIVGERCAGGL